MIGSSGFLTFVADISAGCLDIRTIGRGVSYISRGSMSSTRCSLVSGDNVRWRRIITLAILGVNLKLI